MHRVEKLLLRAADRCRLPARAGAALLATLESIWCGGECSARCPGRRTGRIIPVRDALLLEELPELGSPEDLVRAIKDYARVSVRGFLPVPDPPLLAGPPARRGGGRHTSRPGIPNPGPPSRAASQRRNSRIAGRNGPKWRSHSVRCSHGLVPWERRGLAATPSGSGRLKNGRTQRSECGLSLAMRELVS